MNKPGLNEGEKTVIKILNQIFDLEKKRIKSRNRIRCIEILTG
jgi:hypothetical protein